MRYALGFLVVITAWALGYSFRHLRGPATRPSPTQAVEFAACGSTAGILLVKSDGSTTWYRPPFDGLQQAAEGLPDDAQFKVDYCPEIAL